MVLAGLFVEKLFKVMPPRHCLALFNLFGAVSQILFTYLYTYDLCLFIIRLVVGLNQGVIIT